MTTDGTWSRCRTFRNWWWWSGNGRTTRVTCSRWNGRCILLRWTTTRRWWDRWTLRNLLATQRWTTDILKIRYIYHISFVLSANFHNKPACAWQPNRQCGVDHLLVYRPWVLMYYHTLTQCILFHLFQRQSINRTPPFHQTTQKPVKQFISHIISNLFTTIYNFQMIRKLKNKPQLTAHCK